MSRAWQRAFRLNTGDLFHAEEGDAHRAEPTGEARILVIERAGSLRAHAADRSEA
jgi:quercetin dioxygenase-like cupin family protein